MNFLQKTSTFILILFIASFAHEPKHWMFYIFQILLPLLFLTSYMFWGNPIKDGFWHIADRMLVRVMLLLSVIYTIFYNTPVWTDVYILLVGLFFISALGSKYYSGLEWGSLDHIRMHAFLHYYGFILGIFTIG
jgi:hypothetical protein